METNRLSPSALARALGVSRQMIYRYIWKGQIDRPHGGFDLAAVRRQISQNLRRKLGGSPRRGTCTRATPQLVSVGEEPGEASELRIGPFE
jgi:hypothetical protein